MRIRHVSRWPRWRKATAQGLTSHTGTVADFKNASTSGWSLLHCVALFASGVTAGAVLGAVTAGILVLASRPDWTAPGEVGLAGFALFIGGAVGAVVATTAAIGAFLGLLALDRSGNLSAARRSLVAGFAAAAAIVALLSLPYVAGLFDIGFVGISVLAAVSGALTWGGARTIQRRSMNLLPVAES